MIARVTRAAAAVAAAALLVTGCGSGTTAPTALTSPNGVTMDGPEVSRIAVSDNFGAAPLVQIPHDIAAVSSDEARIVVTGTGAPITADDFVALRYEVHDLLRGGVALPYATMLTEGPLATASLPPAINEVLIGLPSNSRIALLSPDPDGADGTRGQQVTVIDAIRVPAGATAPESFRDPALAGLSVPGDAAHPDVDVVDPEALGHELEVRLATEVAADSTYTRIDSSLLVEYTFRDRDGNLIKSTADTPGPEILNLTRTLPGLQIALSGRPIGARVVAVIPAELAYGNDLDAPVAADTDLVVAIDIVAGFTGEEVVLE